jgi:hypothetical protein
MNIIFLVGIDGKKNTILSTVKALSGYENVNCYIYDIGNYIINPEIEQELKLYKFVNYIKKENIGTFFVADAYKDFINIMPKNEWFMVFDGDERPGPAILQNYKQITDFLDSKKLSTGSCTDIPHWFGNSKSLVEHNKMTLEKADNTFKKNIFIKNDDSIFMENTGNHCGLYSKNHAGTYVGHCLYEDKNIVLYYTHIKTTFHQHNGTVLWSCKNFKESIGVVDENELSLLNEFYDRYKISTSNDFVIQLLNNKVFLNEVTDFFMTLNKCKAKTLSISYPMWAVSIKRFANLITDEELDLYIKECDVIYRNTINEPVSNFYKNEYIEIKYDNFIDNYKHNINRYVYCQKECCNYKTTQI